MTAPIARDYAVFVGDVSLDEFFRTERWPGPGEKVDITPIGSHVGGMIANAAAVYAGFGDATRFLWAMNDGPLTGPLLADLESLGIDTSLVVRDGALADSRNLIVLADGEHTVLTPVLGLDRIELTERAFDALQGARYVYTAIGDLRALRYEDMDAPGVVAAFRGAGARLVLDLDVGALRPGDEVLVAAADILLANRLGFERLCAGRTAADTARTLLAGAARVVVVTLAGDGCRLYSIAGDVAVPGLRVEPVDVTGAGDTFGASFIHALDRAQDPAVAAAFANAAAARAVTMVGGRAGIATEEEVASFAREHGLAISLLPPPDRGAVQASERHDDRSRTSERNPT